MDGHSYYDDWGFTTGFDSEGKGARMRDRPGPYITMLEKRADGSLETYTQWRKAQKVFENAFGADNAASLRTTLRRVIAAT